MKNIWILTANRSEAKFYRFTPHGSQLELVETLSCEDARLPTKRLREDKQGVLYEHFSTYRHSMSSPHKENQDLLDQFTGEIANYLDKVRGSDQMDGLAIVAAPKSLGSIKKHLNHETEKLVLSTIAKNPSPFKAEQVMAMVKESLGNPLTYSA